MTAIIAWALPYIVTAAGAIAALAAIWFSGRNSAKTDAALKDAKAAAKSHERMNDVETLRDASDADRVAELHGFAKRNRNP